MKYILPLFLIVLLCVHRGQAAKYFFSREFDKINEHLEKKVADDDVAANMAEAERMLDKLNQKSESCFLISRSSTCELIRSLEIFVGLQQLVEPTSCGDRSSTLVFIADRAAGMSNQMIKQPKRRIEKLIYHFAKRHFDLCHQDMYTPLFDRLDEQSRKYLIKLGEAKLFANIDLACLQLIREQVAAEKGEANPIFWKHRVTEAELDKYILTPCRTLRRNMDGFGKIITREFEHYDMDLGQYNEIYTKRSSVVYCQFILRHEEIYDLMLATMDMEYQLGRELTSCKLPKSDSS